MTALELFRSGHDTAEIAHILRISEDLDLEIEALASRIRQAKGR